MSTKPAVSTRSKTTSANPKTGASKAPKTAPGKQGSKTAKAPAKVAGAAKTTLRAQVPAPVKAVSPSRAPAAAAMPNMTKTTAGPLGSTSPAPTNVSETPVTSTAPVLRQRELINSVVERSGVRKKFAKPVVETMIAVLGEAISEGRDMNLQPLGRIKQQRTKDTGNAQIIIAKIRQNKSARSTDHDSKTDIATAAE